MSIIFRRFSIMMEIEEQKKRCKRISRRCRHLNYRILPSEIQSNVPLGTEKTSFVVVFE